MAGTVLHGTMTSKPLPKENRSCAGKLGYLLEHLLMWLVGMPTMIFMFLHALACAGLGLFMIFLAQSTTRAVDRLTFGQAEKQNPDSSFTRAMENVKFSGAVVLSGVLADVLAYLSLGGARNRIVWAIMCVLAIGIQGFRVYWLREREKYERTTAEWDSSSETAATVTITAEFIDLGCVVVAAIAGYFARKADETAAMPV
ncbi:hypothetical protein H9P43_009573 [Blastocladiella emersonii ATCC 22665]|nr:hypothetical protein H9P43_009562 [Blastocladiella emersonii ATCC 22665]KAI9150958.1 hypothetical protein H9P43_009573 [Blastocladiella emersonii ATCC 22665]